jgi:hypothetical protein
MRNIFLLLLLANLGLYLWSYQKNNTLAESVVSLPSTLPTLTLLSELPPELDNPMVEKSTTEEIEEQEQLLVSIAEAETIAPSEALVVIDKLEEPQPDEEVDLNIVSQYIESSPQATFCFKTKAFELESLLSPIEKILLLSNVVVKREKAVVDVRVGYWVLIPPSDDRNAALEMVEKLKEHGITDVRRFTKGELVNAISLGLFRKKEYADRRSDIVKKRGFETKIKPRMRLKDGYILHIESSDKAFPDKRLWLALSADKAHFQLQREPCSSE